MNSKQFNTYAGCKGIRIRDESKDVFFNVLVQLRIPDYPDGESGGIRTLIRQHPDSDSGNIRTLVG